jgi:hypothetical protein
MTLNLQLQGLVLLLLFIAPGFVYSRSRLHVRPGMEGCWQPAASHDLILYLCGTGCLLKSRKNSRSALFG